MDDALAHTLTRLRKGDVHRLAVRRGDGIALFEGEVWLTQEGARDDVVVSAGDTHTFERDGSVWLQALRDAAWIRLGNGLVAVDAAAHRRAEAAPPISAFALASAARRARDAAVGRTASRLIATLRAAITGRGRLRVSRQ